LTHFTKIRKKVLKAALKISKLDFVNEQYQAGKIYSSSSKLLFIFFQKIFLQEGGAFEIAFLKCFVGLFC